MYERFTEEARQAMERASKEAQRFCHEYIGTEHILLGVIDVGGESGAATILTRFGVSYPRLKEAVEARMQQGSDMVTMGKLPQTPRAKKVIEFAVEEARGCNAQYVGIEHLLLGLLREIEGVAAQVLTETGVRLDDVRALVREMYSPEASLDGDQLVLTVTLSPTAVVNLRRLQEISGRETLDETLIAALQLYLPPGAKIIVRRVQLPPS
jgi:ATP-dependent Clp protease ATP-binding subunit ClpA